MRATYILPCAAWIASVLAAPPSDNLTQPGCDGVNGLRPQCAPVEAAHRREVFHVGGHYEVNPQTKQHELVDRMYVEKLTPYPKASKKYPLVFFHGGGFSGAVSYP